MPAPTKQKAAPGQRDGFQIDQISKHTNTANNIEIGDQMPELDLAPRWISRRFCLSPAVAVVVASLAGFQAGAR